MKHFPVFMDLHRQDVLVVGGGSVAERKIRILLDAGAKVDVAAATICTNVQNRVRQGDIAWCSQRYFPGLLEGKRLVFAATDDSELNQRVFHDAEQQNIPVNVVDDVAHCRFISPAVIDRSPVQVAVSTGGASPVLARRIRNRIERQLPMGLGRVAAAAGALREQVKRRLPAQVRRKFWENLLLDSRLQQWAAMSPLRISSEMQSALKANQPGREEGMVYLVGAGPGNPDLLTLRALNVLGSADVVLYDRLVSTEVLDLARRDADRIYVGKQAGKHQCRQEEIHRIMLEEAGKGRAVVRLKGGDAFVFGRGGEELEVLREAGVRYEVVPGITAAIGCAAYAGIPLTHRLHAQSVSFVTGHQAPAGQGENAEIDWAGIAGEGRTAVVYMGIKQAESIRSGLLEAGISPDLPVALVEDGSRVSQRVLEGTVGGIPALANRARSGRPGLLVIGQVAALGSTLGWFESLHTIPNAA